MRSLVARAGARVFRVVAVSLPVTVVVGVLAQGQGFPVPSHPMDSGGAWVASLSAGTLTLIDGPSKQVVTDVDVAQPGEVITAVQAGSGAYVANQSSGTVTRVDGATYRASEGMALIDGAGPGLQVFAGDRLVYVMDRQRGAVVAADTTLQRSQPPASLAALVTDGVVDRDGRLWILDGASGDLITLDDGGRNVNPALVDPARADLELAGDQLAVIDQTARTIHVVDPGSREIVEQVCIDVAVGDQSIRVTGSPDAHRVHVVSGQRGILLTSDLATGDCTSFVQVAEPGAVLGVPQEAGGRVFVPNFSTGQVHIVDISDGEVTADADLFDGATEFELLSRNGIVFYNDPHGRRAGVIDLDGTVHPIDKYDAENRGDRDTDTPGRGRKDGRDDDKSDGKDKNDDRKDKGDQEDGDDRPDSDEPGDPKPLQPLELEPDAGPSQPLPDLGLPPAPNGEDQPQTGPGGINPPVVDPPAGDPPGQDPPSQDPPGQDPPGEDPPTAPPSAEFTCNSTSLTEGDQLQCTWSGNGGTPDTWNWNLTGPETATATSTSFTHTMNAPGDYDLTLTVANAAGPNTHGEPITVAAAPDPPQVSLLCIPASPFVGSNVECNASTSGDVERELWTWDPPGAGGYSGREQSSLSETFTQPGTHQVTVTVEGPGGTVSDDWSISVQDQPPEPPQITFFCHSPGGLGNEDPPQWFGGQALTCNADTTGEVDSIEWTFSPGGETKTGEDVWFVLPGQGPGERTDGRVDVTASGPGGTDSGSLDFIIRACDNHPDPPCRRM